MAETTRVLFARNYFEVMSLPVQETEVTIVRKQYLRIALLVHPDKCQHEDAGKAFKVLTQAFECLSNLHTQFEYMKKVGNVVQETLSKPRKRQKKRNNEEMKFEKWWWEYRDPKEREEQMRMQEEALLKEMGIDKERQERKQQLKKARLEAKQELIQEQRLQMAEEVLERCTDNSAAWKHWKSQQKKTPQVPKRSQNPNNEVYESVCLLCKRKFLDNAALERHIQLSDLHRQNLEQQNTKT